MIVWMYDTLQIIKQVMLLGNLRKKNQSEEIYLSSIYLNSLNFFCPSLLVFRQQTGWCTYGKSNIGRVNSLGIIWLPREGVDNGRKGCLLLYHFLLSIPVFLFLLYHFLLSINNRWLISQVDIFVHHCNFDGYGVSSLFGLLNGLVLQFWNERVFGNNSVMLTNGWCYLFWTCADKGKSSKFCIVILWYTTMCYEEVLKNRSTKVKVSLLQVRTQVLWLSKKFPDLFLMTSKSHV